MFKKTLGNVWLNHSQNFVYRVQFQATQFQCRLFCFAVIVFLFFFPDNFTSFQLLWQSGCLGKTIQELRKVFKRAVSVLMALALIARLPGFLNYVGFIAANSAMPIITVVIVVIFCAITFATKNLKKFRFAAEQLLTSAVPQWRRIISQWTKDADSRMILQKIRTPKLAITPKTLRIEYFSKKDYVRFSTVFEIL